MAVFSHIDRRGGDLSKGYNSRGHLVAVFHDGFSQSFCCDLENMQARVKNLRANGAAQAVINDSEYALRQLEQAHSNEAATQ